MTDDEESTKKDKKTLEEFKNENLKDGQLLRSYMRRRGGGLVLFLQVDEEIEDFMSSDDIDESSEWHGGDGYHEFYYKNYSDELARHTEMKNDQFGGKYISDGHVNIGLLRTVGLSDGVEFELPGKYSEESLLDSMKELKEEVEILYKQFIRPVRITGSLSMSQV